MPRTFTCIPKDPFYTLGSSHQWTVEESPLEEGITLLPCPFHENPQSYHEGPWQGPDLMLVESLERMGGWAAQP